MVANPESDKGTVLILAYHYPPENTSGAARPFRFSKYLPNFGYSTRVIASSNQNGMGSDENVHRGPDETTRRTSLAIATRTAEIVQRYCLPFNERLPWFPYALATAANVMADNPVSAVLSTSPPLVTHLVALQLKRRYGVKWIADFRDPLRDSPFRTRKGTGWYNAMLERWIFRNADVVIANTAPLADAWGRRYPQWSYKIAVVWNGFDPEEAYGPAPIPPRNSRVLAHVGSLYGGRHPGVLLSSIERLTARGLLDPADLRIRLVGPIEEECVRMYQACFLSLTSKGSLEYDGRLVPQQEARQTIAEADYLLLLDVNNLNIGLQVPAKVFDYIRVGRPILAFTARNSATEKVLSQSGVPYKCIYSDDSEAQIDNKVLSFASLPTSATAPNPCFQQEFNVITQTATLSSILDRLRGKHTSFVSHPNRSGNCPPHISSQTGQEAHGQHEAIAP